MGSLVILAAGMGNRYGGTKQLKKLGPHNRSIIDYTIYDAIKAGFKKFVFVIRKDIEQTFHNHIYRKWENKADLRIVYQEIDSLPKQYEVPKDRNKPWGTAHAIWTAEPVLQEPFAVVNADDFYGRKAIEDSFNQLSRLNPDKKEAFIVAYKLINTLSPSGPVSRGLCKIDNQNNLTQIKEISGIETKGGGIRCDSNSNSRKKVLNQPNALISMNLMGFTPLVFKTIRKGFSLFYHKSESKNSSEYYITEVLNLLITEGVKVTVTPTESSWFGVTFREDNKWVNQQLKNLHQSGVYPNDF